MINLIVNGNSYSYPQPGDKANTGWGSQATNWASAVTAALTALGLGGTLTPTPNTVIDINSTTKGILVPRLTTTQRNAITSPATSLLIFNTTLGVFQYYSGSAWITIGAKIPDNVQFDGTLTVNGNISTNGGVTAVGAVTGASLNTTGLATAATANFTDATDATNSTTAPVKTAGGLGIAKKLFVGTDANVGGNANITGKALTGDGTVSAPTYSFVNDPDTGLYRIGANQFGFSANGVRQGEFGVGYGGFTGNIIQVTYAELTTSGVTSTASIPADNTIPQNTEGAEILTCSITPKYSNSILYIESLSFLGENTNSVDALILALFRDSTADAIATSFNNAQPSANSPFTAALNFNPTYILSKVNANSTNNTTFKLRAGGASAGVGIRWNGVGGNQFFNGTLITYIRILEVQV